MRSRRLLWQLYPSYLIIALVSVIAVSWFAGRAFRQFYLDHTAEDLTARARLVREQVRLPITEADRPALDVLCDRLGRQSGTRITIILADGVVAGDSQRDAAAMENHADRPEIIDALKGGIGMSTRYSETLRKRMMYVAVPVEDRVAPSAVVRASLPVVAGDAALRGIYARVLAGGSVIVVLATVISLLISRRIARPLEELRRGAERFAAGSLDTRLDVPEAEEIGALAETMNRMAEQLDERIETIVQQKHQEEAILVSMVESVLAVDAEGRVLTANDAAGKLFGIDFTHCKGQLLQEVLRHHQLHEVVAHALGSEAPLEEEITLYDPDERFLQVHGTVLRDPAGRRIGALVVFNDITRLRRLEQVRRDFVANVSHELKTPITTIKGFVETLLGGAMNDRQDAERFLSIIAKHTERLNAIIEDLLALSRIEQGHERERVALQRQRVCDVVAQAIDACRVSAHARDVKVTMVGDKALECNINGPLIEQAVVNLIDNAIKYSETGDEVTVKVEHTADSHVAVHVVDNGCGIEAEHLPRLFERFYRTDKARSRSLGGTGLGLAIVKHIAIAHGGRVEVQSRIGQGSTFTMLLPANHM